GIICINPILPAPQTSPRRPHSPALPGSNPGVLAPSPRCSNPPAPTPVPELGREPRSPGSQSPTLSHVASEGSPGVGVNPTAPPGTLSLFPEMLPKPTVTPNQAQVLENGTFTLTCNSSPHADTLLWLRDGASLAPSDRLGLSPDNRTLTVSGATRGDAGAYQCEVRNPVSTERSEPSTVTVAYGPDSARIDPPGPIDLTLGSPLTLSCVADSVPAPSCRWVLNGTDTNETGTSLTFNPTTLAHQGTYECQAHNPITNRTARASVAMRVTGTAPVAPRPGLSAGAVAGIVIGSLAGAALVGVGAYFLYSRSRNETPRETGAPVLVYENLPPKAGKGPVAQPGSPPDTSPTYQTLQPRQQDVYEELKK
ncbi:unnamed protein product, partial [Lepidochelys olivacea]